VAYDFGARLFFVAPRKEIGVLHHEEEADGTAADEEVGGVEDEVIVGKLVFWNGRICEVRIDVAGLCG
jgi:hypothetical protein